MPRTIKTSKEEWRRCLSPEEYLILREAGTESPFSGKLLHNKEKGVYECAACGNPLFSSDTKFDSGTGWPSFWDPASEKSVEFKTDEGYGGTRTEVLCKKCGGHLGHVFDDGPKEETGKRYCINSVSLSFKKGQ